MNKKSVEIYQLNAKMQAFARLQQVVPPPIGWLKAVRTALGMTLQQLSNRRSISKQSIREIEQREVEGSITLKSLREAAAAMDMQLVYGLVPKDGSLDNLIHRKSADLARQIVLRTSNSMKLEDQEISYQRLEKAIEERTTILKNEMPKSLWD